MKTEETHRERQLRHDAHQLLMQSHKDAKALRRENHNRRKHQRIPPPNTYI